MPDNVFETENVASSVETLVGEGKKYANTDEAIKALGHAQAHIARLEQEAKERKEQEDSVKRFESLLERQEQLVRTPPASDQEKPPVSVPAQEDLAKLVREVTQQSREEEQVKANIQEVSTKLTELYGDRASEMVQQKANELGVSVQFLQGVAAKSPKAFYAQLGVTGTPQVAPQASKNTVNVTGSPSGAKEGTFSYYQNIRSTDPKLYSSPKIQNEMMKKAMEFGPGWTGT